MPTLARARDLELARAPPTDDAARASRPESLLKLFPTLRAFRCLRACASVRRRGRLGAAMCVRESE